MIESRLCNIHRFLIAALFIQNTTSYLELKNDNNNFGKQLKTSEDNDSFEIDHQITENLLQKFQSTTNAVPTENSSKIKPRIVKPKFLSEEKIYEADAIKSNFSSIKTKVALHHTSSEIVDDSCNDDCNSNNQSFGISTNQSTNSQSNSHGDENPKAFPLYIRIWASVALTVVALVGAVGNILVFLLVCLNNDLRHSTNLFLLNLALADLLVLFVCLPTAMIELHVQPDTWVLGSVMCWLVPLIEVMVSRASVLTLLVISCERYLAICRPLRTATIWSRPRAATVCLCLWFLAFLSSIPTFLATQFIETTDSSGSNIDLCLTGLHHQWVVYYYLLSAVIFVLVPFIFLLAIYSIIASKLLLQRPSTSPRYLAMQQWRAKKQVAIMLGAVVAVFFLCVLPFQVLTVWIILSSDETLAKVSVETFYNTLYFCRLMLYINSASNPLIYNAMSSKFRNAFHRLFNGELRNTPPEKCLRRRSTMTTSVSSNSFISLRRRASEVFSRTLARRFESKGSHPQEPSSSGVSEIRRTRSMPCNERERVQRVQRDGNKTDNSSVEVNRIRFIRNKDTPILKNIKHNRNNSGDQCEYFQSGIIGECETCFREAGENMVATIALTLRKGQSEALDFGTYKSSQEVSQGSSSSNIVSHHQASDDTETQNLLQTKDPTVHFVAETSKESCSTLSEYTFQPTVGRKDNSNTLLNSPSISSQSNENNMPIKIENLSSIEVKYSGDENEQIGDECSAPQCKQLVKKVSFQNIIGR